MEADQLITASYPNNNIQYTHVLYNIYIQYTPVKYMHTIYPYNVSIQYTQPSIKDHKMRQRRLRRPPSKVGLIWASGCLMWQRFVLRTAWFLFELQITSF